MTTTDTVTVETTPVVDRLSALIDHLAEVGQPDLAEHVASLRPLGRGLEVYFLTNRRHPWLRFAATIDAPQVDVDYYGADGTASSRAWYQLIVNGSIAGMPVRTWTSVDEAEGDSVESVAEAARAELAALTAGGAA